MDFRGIARAGHGQAEFILSASAHEFEKAVNRQVARLLEAAWTDVTLTWDSEEKVLLQAPTKLPVNSIFTNPVIQLFFQKKSLFGIMKLIQLLHFFPLKKKFKLR